MKNVAGRSADQTHGIDEYPHHEDVGRNDGVGALDGDEVAAAEHEDGCFVSPAVGHTAAQSQSVQEDEPFTGEKEPGAQSVQFGAPAPEKEPAGHAAHASMLVAPKSGFAVPGRHSVGDWAAYADHVPGGVVVQLGPVL